MVSANNKEADKAKTMVNATGANNLPSKPSNESNGKNTMAIIRIPELTGDETSLTAHLTRLTTGACWSSSWAKCATTFSTITTAASTSKPMAMAKPPKLMRLADKPNWRMRINVPNTDKGRMIATTKAARILPKKATKIITTRIAASVKALLTVCTAFSTNTERS